MLRSLAWQGRQWQENIAKRTDVTTEMRAGLRAYATHQKTLCEALAAQFKQLWSVPLKIRTEYDLGDTFVAEGGVTEGGGVMEGSNASEEGRTTSGGDIVGARGEEVTTEEPRRLGEAGEGGAQPNDERVD